MNKLDNMPIEIIMFSVGFLKKKELCLLGAVSKIFQEITSDHMFWSSLIKEKFSYNQEFAANYKGTKQDFVELAKKELIFLKDWHDYLKRGLCLKNEIFPPLAYNFTEIKKWNCRVLMGIGGIGLCKLATMQIPEKFMKIHLLVMNEFQNLPQEPPKRSIYMGKL